MGYDFFFTYWDYTCNCYRGDLNTTYSMLNCILNEEKTHGVIRQPEFLISNPTTTPIEMKNVFRLTGLVGASGAIIKAGKRTVCIGV
jgi:hypothetical protein